MVQSPKSKALPDPRPRRTEQNKVAVGKMWLAGCREDVLGAQNPFLPGFYAQMAFGIYSHFVVRKKKSRRTIQLLHATHINL